MSRKVYISSSQYGVLSESEWNFHFGSNHDLRPHVSDNKYCMAGRETGHFGSGTYFSTYRDIKNIDDYGELSGNQNPNFIEIHGHLYRVDFDLYKNLYRVRSKKQGDVLYTMLCDLNHMFYRISDVGRYSPMSANYSNSGLYQRIRVNADGLGLRCPSYYELTRMAQRLSKDDDDIRSFSTMFMEWNGYNGVNVSGIEFYDNTKHGSVIYDLSKVDTEMEEVSPRNLYDGFKDSYYNDTIVRGYGDNAEMDALDGEYLDWYYKLNGMPIPRAMRILKNFTDSGNILNYFKVNDLNGELIKRYLRLLFVKNPMGDWNDPILDEIIEGDRSKYWCDLFEEYGAYYWLNYVPRVGKYGKGKYSSVLVNMLNRFIWNLPWDADVSAERKMKEDYLNKLMSYMDRDLTPYEQEYIKEDYFDE